MNRVVLSSDTNLDYAFFIPITCLFWKLRGYKPLLFLVGTAKQWSTDFRLRLALEGACEVGAEVHFVPEMEGVRTSTIAQCVRLCASGVPGLAADDMLILSDIDMLPLGEWVGGNVDHTKRLHLYYANAYKDSPYTHYPMCYQLASVETWTEITGAHTDESIGSPFCESLACVINKAPEDPSGAWNWDEKYLGSLIEGWMQWDSGNTAQFIDRTFVKGEWRLDRSDWDGSFARMKGSLDGVADAHLLRPGFGDNWSRIRPLLELALPAKWLVWCDSYHAGWI